MEFVKYLDCLVAMTIIDEVGIFQSLGREPLFGVTAMSNETCGGNSSLQRLTELILLGHSLCLVKLAKFKSGRAV